MLLALSFLLLIANGFAIQNKNEVCTILSICDKISLIRLQVADIREEQGRQANILEGTSTASDSASDLNASTSNNNNELCTIPWICNNLAELSAELAAVREEQGRQADLLEESCQTDTDSYPANCYEALKKSQKSSVIEILVPAYSENPFKVACDQESHDGGWTIILRRTDGSEDFYRERKDYKEGFGQVNGEYFVGLDALHALTSAAPQELLVLLESIGGAQMYEKYDNFRVGNETNQYTLESLGTPSGTADDALTFHLGMKFTTKDLAFDNAIPTCAIQFTGAWWFKNCLQSNLAGLYANTTYWKTSTSLLTMKTAIMMIRPRK